jgi:hypothetical protein
MRTVILDNEAVQALADPAHRKHRAIVAHLAGGVTRRRRGRPTDIVVPTAVRVEAGWDRSQAGASALNRFPVRDRALDGAAANAAATIASRTGTSVADAHVGATARAVTTGDVVVLSSDPADMRAVCGPTPVHVVRI